jgi:hypothetical protein
LYLAKNAHENIIFFKFHWLEPETGIYFGLI